MALLALHSLRRSEILALTPESFDRERNVIMIRGAIVETKDNTFVFKATNKTDKSTRDIVIMIPRLLELVPKTGTEYLVQCHPNSLSDKINAICRRADLPQVGVKGLRSTYATLAYTLHWDDRAIMATAGWSTISTAHKHYIKVDELEDKVKTMTDFYKDHI